MDEKAAKILADAILELANALHHLAETGQDIGPDDENCPYASLDEEETHGA